MIYVRSELGKAPVNFFMLKPGTRECLANRFSPYQLLILLVICGEYIRRRSGVIQQFILVVGNMILVDSRVIEKYEYIAYVFLAINLTILLVNDFAF